MRIDRDVRSHEFGYRKMRTLEIGENVRTIGDRAFCECHRLRKVVFSVVIMAIVLLYKRGIMGDKELSISGIRKRLAERKKKKVKP